MEEFEVTETLAETSSAGSHSSVSCEDPSDQEEFTFHSPSYKFPGSITQGNSGSVMRNNKITSSHNEDHYKTLSILEQLQRNQETVRDSVYTLLGRATSCSDQATPPPPSGTCCTCGYQPPSRDKESFLTNNDGELGTNTCTCTSTGVHVCTCTYCAYNNPELDESLNSCEEEYSSISDHTQSSDVSLIENMWDDFTISDYVPDLCRKRVKRVPPSGRDFSPPRRVTVPVPFSMTLREEGKKKTKSRSLQIAEKEKMEKEAEEEAHLAKQFKANPIPATTFLPLYEMINACNQQRREEIKHTSKQILKSLERPFSFMAREEAKKRERESCMLLVKEMSNKQDKERQQFQAKPIPGYVFDSNVMERIKEEAEYRKIRIRLRALESLAGSHLPHGMRIRGQQYNLERLLRRIGRENGEDTDFVTSDDNTGIKSEQGFEYNDFEQELARRQRQVKTSTLLGKPTVLLTDPPQTEPPIIKHSTPTKSILKSSIVL